MTKEFTQELLKLNLNEVYENSNVYVFEEEQKNTLLQGSVMEKTFLINNNLNSKLFQITSPFENLTDVQKEIILKLQELNCLQQEMIFQSIDLLQV
jgi:hypothetical protein